MQQTFIYLDLIYSMRVYVAKDHIEMSGRESAIVGESRWASESANTSQRTRIVWNFLPRWFLKLLHTSSEYSPQERWQHIFASKTG